MAASASFKNLILSNQSITKWLDASGNEYHQSPTSNGDIWRSMWLNVAGDAIRSGTGENRTNEGRQHVPDTSFPSLAKPLTIAIRFRENPDNAGTCYLFGNRTIVGGIASYVTGSHFVACIVDGSAVTGSSWSATPGAWHVVYFVWNGTSTGYIYFDEPSTIRRSGSGAAGPVSYTEHTLGSGQGTDSNLVEISDVVVWNAIHNSTDRQAVFSYLHRNTSFNFDQTSSSHGADFSNILSYSKSDPFSVLIWVNTSSTVSTQVLWGKYDSAATDGYYAYWADSTNRINMYMKSSSGNFTLLSYCSFSTFNDGNWHLVLITYDGSGDANGISFYVDGTQLTTNVILNTNTADDMVNDVSFLVGKFPVSGNSIVGKWRHCIVWDKELSSTESDALYALLGDGGLNPDFSTVATANAEAYWPVTYTEWDDYPAVYDHIRKHLVLNVSASDEYVTMGDVLGYERTDPFSVCFWIKTTDSDGPFVGKQEGASPYQGWLAWCDSGRLRFDLLNNTSSNAIKIRTSSSINTGSWVHVACTYDGSSSASGVTIYLNGVSSATSTLANTLSASISNTENFQISKQGNRVAWNIIGRFSQIATYGKELTSSEVLEIYNEALTGDLTTCSSSSDIDAYWPIQSPDNSSSVGDNGPSGYDGTPVNMDDSNFEGADGTITLLSDDYVIPAVDWPDY